MQTGNIMWTALLFPGTPLFDRLDKEGRILTKDGVEIQLSGDTICVHGDNPAAVNLVKQIRKTLSESNIDIVPMGEFLQE